MSSCVAANYPKRKTLSKELEEEESTLKLCIEKLKVVETNRLSLVSQLREALNEQVSDKSICIIFLFLTYILVLFLSSNSLSLNFLRNLN